MPCESVRDEDSKDLEIAKGRFRQPDGREDVSKPESYAGVWDAIADTSELTDHHDVHVAVIVEIAKHQM
jgi:hypothetical protein